MSRRVPQKIPEGLIKLPPPPPPPRKRIIGDDIEIAEIMNGIKLLIFKF